VLDYWITGKYPSEQDLQAVSQGRAIAPPASTPASAPIGAPRQDADMARPVNAPAP